jgi:hypothetical protein
MVMFKEIFDLIELEMNKKLQISEQSVRPVIYLFL